MKKNENKEIVARTLSAIEKLASTQYNFMEVCGTHTMAIASSGLRSLLPKKLKMLSGPGCPVCVTAIEDIDKVIAIAKIENVITATFGDMIKVPGSDGSLEKARADGCDVRIVYSCNDAIQIAIDNPSKSVVFPGVGFETTSPTIAATVLNAEKRGVKNFFVIPLFKLVPPALELIVSIKDIKVDGFLLPGHVSTIIGVRPYQFMAEKYGKPCVIAGFEPLDILFGILMLLKQIEDKKPKVEVQYTRSVRYEGNPVAIDIMNRVFKTSDANWRAIGVIKDTGYTFSKEFASFNALEIFIVKTGKPKEHKGCLCGKILLGLNVPPDCKLFGKACTPSSAVGPCMVSSEGACAAYYKYGS